MSDNRSERLKQMFSTNIEEITQLVEMNTHRNENGEVYIAKDDEWRDETEWDDIYEWDMIAKIFEDARKRNGFTKDDVEKICEKLIDEVRNDKENNPIITITKENEHVLKPEMTEERKKKIALMKKRVAIITKNMED